MKVDVSRRQALGLFGGGAAAVATLAPPNLTKLKGGLTGARGDTVFEIEKADPDDLKDIAKRLLDNKKVLKYFFDKGMPDFEKEKLKRESREIYSINPDIASLRSVSLVAKCNMQAKDNYKKAIDTFEINRNYTIKNLAHRINTGMNIDIW